MEYLGWFSVKERLILGLLETELQNNIGLKTIPSVAARRRACWVVFFMHIFEYELVDNSV